MFWLSKLEKSQKEEIEFLRAENKELRLQLIAMSDKSSQYFNAKLASKKLDVKTPDSVLKSIDDQPAKSPEDIKKKERAKQSYLQIINGC